jgi:radical SAM protein with 4Fe4S-binding SPASM domain
VLGIDYIMEPSDLLQKLDVAGLRPPGMLTLAITGSCNLACCHCWVRAGEVSSPSHEALPVLRRLVEEFVAVGGYGIRITGGEPLCHPDWLDLMQYSRSLGVAAIALQTNALLFMDEHLTALQKLDFSGLSIQVSLDGATPRSHDLVRGAGAFHGALRGIAALVRAGLGSRVTVFFTEMRHNLGELPELLELADRMGLTSVVSGSLVTCGRASESTLIASPEVEQYNDLLERYDRDARFRELYRRIGTVAALEWRTGDARRSDCCTFIENPYLTPSGRLYPCLLCHTDEFSVSSVFEKGLTAAFAEGIPLWSTLLDISRNRVDAISECRDCPGQFSCAGGCMGRAWGSCGNLLAADDRCGVRRSIYQRVADSRQ